MGRSLTGLFCQLFQLMLRHYCDSRFCWECHIFSWVKRGCAVGEFSCYCLRQTPLKNQKIASRALVFKQHTRLGIHCYWKFSTAKWLFLSQSDTKTCFSCHLICYICRFRTSWLWNDYAKRNMSMKCCLLWSFDVNLVITG